MKIQRNMTMKDQDGNWTPLAKRLVWEKAPYVDANHPECGNNDPCKACIKKECYGNRSSNHGWEIDHIIPESILQNAGVPQELIDDIDNLRPMHWRNNVQKSDDFPIYGGVVSAIGDTNLEVSRDYQVNRDQINVLRNLYADYLDIPQPTLLGKWQVMIDRENVPTHRIPAVFFDDITTPSIHDLDD